MTVPNAHNSCATYQRDNADGSFWPFAGKLHTTSLWKKRNKKIIIWREKIKAVGTLSYGCLVHMAFLREIHFCDGCMWDNWTVMNIFFDSLLTRADYIFNSVFLFMTYRIVDASMPVCDKRFECNELSAWADSHSMHTADKKNSACFLSISPSGSQREKPKCRDRLSGNHRRNGILNWL